MRGLCCIGTLLMLFAWVGCHGDLPGTGDDDPGKKNTTNTDDQYAPCTDYATCCTQDNRRCFGDPDTGGVVCTCSELWDCSKNPNKCSAEILTPNGTGTWKCTWEDYAYKCTQEGQPGSPKPTTTGSANWDCVYNDTEFQWECTTRDIPNPTNTPEGLGGWKCTVDTEQQLLTCDRTAPQTPTTGEGQWKEVGGAGSGTWQKQDENGGLPTGGGEWRCSRTLIGNQNVWICYGEVPPGGTPPGGGSWTCEKVSSGEFDVYRCSHAEVPSDYPPGGGWFSCVKGTEFGGTQCTQVESQPIPPGPTPTPGQKCEITEKMWCDGLSYCGWGQVACDEKTLTWKTVTKEGKVLLDCQESLAQGKVPNTVCACFHYYFNPSCCERPDCIVPPGTDGQTCPASNGQLCDYCNPQKPECKEAGAQCIVTNLRETFCGRNCASQACPSGYTCMTVKLKTGSSRQCIPADFSCYR